MERLPVIGKMPNSDRCIFLASCNLCSLEEMPTECDFANCDDYETEEDIEEKVDDYYSR